MSEPIQAFPSQWPPGCCGIRLNGIRELHAILDETDRDLVERFEWWAHENGCGSVYARTVIYDGRWRRNVFMHRLLLGEPRTRIDHRNGDGLDNRRHNLRLATASQNAANMRPKGGSSQFKGVKRTRSGSWAARITIDYRQLHIGTFGDELVAAAAYDIYAAALFGEFARPNLGVQFGIINAARDEGLERSRA